MSNYNIQLQSNNTDLQVVLQTLQTKATAGVQATPVISVNASGLITATAGTKTSTHQLAFQAAKTITPSATSQIAVSSGYYTGGNVTVAGDSNLVAGNIKSGVSIFGVSGSYEGSGGSTDVEDGFITRTLTSYINDRVTTIGSGAFCSCHSLTTVSFPAATTIGNNAFHNCTKLTTVSFPAATTISISAFGYCRSLTTVSFPAATSIGDNAFFNCSKLTTISFPAVTTISGGAFNMCSGLTTVSFPAATTIGSSAFYNCMKLTTVSFPAATTISSIAFFMCSGLTTVSFPAATSIGSSAFGRCYNLTSLYLTGSSLCKLSNSNAFTSTPIGGYSNSAGTYGSIYVPASLLTSYKAATNWTYFSSRFVGV